LVVVPGGIVLEIDLFLDKEVNFGTFIMQIWIMTKA
jgi:hypothetical protein